MAQASSTLHTTSSADSAAVSDNCCTTRVSVNKSSYTWVIDNFSYIKNETDDALQSSWFTTGTDIKWCLRLYVRGDVEQSKDNLSLFLLLESKKEVFAEFKFSLLNDKGEESYTKETDYRFTDGKDWGWDKFIKRDFVLDEKNGLLPHDKLTIVCELAVVGDPVTVTSQVTVPECRLSSDVAQLFGSPDFTDCTLIAGGQQFNVHKVILSARSPVFVLECVRNYRVKKSL